MARRSAALLVLAEVLAGTFPDAGDCSEVPAAVSLACHCDFGEDPAWREFASLAHKCWDSGRKLPPVLYSAANALHQDIQARAQLDEELELAGQAAPPWACAPGAFVALLLLLLLWEAHDAPEELLESALAPALSLRRRHLAPAADAEGVVDCRPAAAAAPGRAWPGRIRLAELERLRQRLSRKSAARSALAASGLEAWHPREREEQERRTLPGLCLCLLHGEGAQTLNATLESYREGGLLQLARRRLVAFLEPTSGEASTPEVDCWRGRLAKRYDLEVLRSARDWPDPFIGGRHRRGSPGAAMAACAAACSEEYILFLEDDWELVTRPPELVRHRLLAAMEVLAQGGEAASSAPSSGSRGAPLLGVHLRHKLFFGAPFYELVTAAQHNEPPSPYTAWYFSEDPVAEHFPDGLWAPPFWDSQGPCDSQRRSWWGALAYQRAAARESERRRPRGEGPALKDWDGSPARVWWCSNGSSLLCTSTAAHRDPFRSLMYSTNPTLYRTDVWQLHIASYAAVLQDLRAVEESLSASYMWRVQPSFTLALSLGLFRHRRLDRRRIPPAEEDRDAAACLEKSGAL